MSTELLHPLPPGLRGKGTALWTSYAERYRLRADELRYLEDACRLSDVLALMQAEADGAPMLVAGSMGQKVLNPLVAEQKSFATSIAALLARIKLPDQKAAGSLPADRSSAARKAANARWSRGA